MSVLLEWRFLKLNSLVSLALKCLEYDGCIGGNRGDSKGGHEGDY